MSWNLPGEARFGIHSIDHFALEVPSLDEAQRFFGAFGLRVSRHAGPDRLELRAHGSDHVWARILPGPSKRSAPVQPQCLSHVLMFTPDIDRSIAFCRDVLGLRLSDRSRDAVPFLHARHGSDHHLVAFAGSHYVCDPWGSFAEYSAGIDHVPAGQPWEPGDFPPEDSLALWGPELPSYFVRNVEA